MDDREACRVLGVAVGDSAQDIRTAYRRLLRSHHPDVATDRDATQVTAELNRAYAVLLGTDAAPSRATSTPRAPSPTAGGPDPAVIASTAEDADATLHVAAPAHDIGAVFQGLCSAADSIGALSHVDRANNILETILSPEDGPTCSLMITLEPDDGVLHAHCALESLDARPGPPIREVLEMLSDALDRRVDS